jgi:methylenetetrahydrofolate dehydrogenase (NADP+)/methenyltetrahydrofolate cyclohydrolase
MILDGRIVAQKHKNAFRKIIAEAVEEGQRAPFLQVLNVGDNKASAKYIAMKEQACREVGIRTETYNFRDDISIDVLKRYIIHCNKYDAIDGILLQMPMPESFPVQEILDTIAPEKDVDGLTTYNSGRLYSGKPQFIPCTPAGIMDLIGYYEIETAGKNVVVVGRGPLVGRPIATVLSSHWGDSTVTLCHSKTKDLGKHTKNADILISAVGVPYLITAGMVSKDATVIDAGTGVGINGRICGDVDFEGVYRKVRNITPNPGGVGPMTVAMLIRNTMSAWADAIARRASETENALPA